MELLLKGRSLWEVDTELNDSWGWKNLMTIRNEIAKHVWNKIGNGRNVSMWFDNWCEVGPLFKIITSRHLYDARFARDTVVADMISDGYWNWQNEWDQTYPMVRHI